MENKNKDMIEIKEKSMLKSKCKMATKKTKGCARDRYSLTLYREGQTNFFIGSVEGEVRFSDRHLYICTRVGSWWLVVIISIVSCRPSTWVTPGDLLWRRVGYCISSLLLLFCLIGLEIAVLTVLAQFWRLPGRPIARVCPGGFLIGLLLYRYRCGGNCTVCCRLHMPTY